MPCPLDCIYCYENVKCRRNWKGHRRYVRPRQPYVLRPWEIAMKRSASSESSGAPGDKPAKGDLLSGLPLVWEQLTDDLWDDGSPRLRSTVMVVMDGGTVKLWLHDREGKRSAWVAGESLNEAFEALEHALHHGTIAWRADREQHQKKTGK